MTETFNCASCSAPLEFEGMPTQKCPFCEATVIVPAELLAGRTGVNANVFVVPPSSIRADLDLDEVRRLIRSGNKIEAIKRVREAYEIGLADAKAAVEAIERGEPFDIARFEAIAAQIRASQNAAAVRTASRSIFGFGAMVLVVILAIAGSIIYFTFRTINNAVAKAIELAPTSQPQPKPAEITELLKIGGEGIGVGRFSDNRRVAIDGEGRIYSSNYSPIRVQAFTADGKYLSDWAPEAGLNLYGLAADRQGNVYLANDKGIFKYDGPTGKLLAKNSVYSRDIALDRNGRLVAANDRNITIFDGDLKVARDFKDAAEAANSSFGFEEIAVDGNGVIYAYDQHAGDVCKFSAEGKFLNRIAVDSKGSNGIAVDPAGRLFVSETSSIDVYNDKGTLIKKLPARQAFGLAFDQEGSLFVASRPYIIKLKLNF
jgi:hypothetical protein